MNYFVLIEIYLLTMFRLHGHPTCSHQGLSLVLPFLD